MAVSVVILTWIIQRDLRRRKGRGRACIVCGYDLRATREICPECGMPVAGELLRVALNEAALNRDWPVDWIKPQRPASGERMAFLHAVPSARQGELLANQLRARGVWCVVKPGPEDCALLLVPAVDEERSRAIAGQFRARGEAQPAEEL